MTAIGITAPSVLAAPTRLRLTQRGRRVLAFLAALPAVIALSFAIIGGGSALASLDDAPTASFTTVIVAPGDSLWSIAQSVAPQADPRDVVDAIARLNALAGSTVDPGQKLAIPAEYAPVK